MVLKAENKILNIYVNIDIPYFLYIDIYMWIFGSYMLKMWLAR